MGRIVRASTGMLPNTSVKRHHHASLFDDFGEIVKLSLRTDLLGASYIPHTGTAIDFFFVVIRLFSDLLVSTSYSIG
jgi:hypothetical protein